MDEAKRAPFAAKVAGEMIKYHKVGKGISCFFHLFPCTHALSPQIMPIFNLVIFCPIFFVFYVPELFSLYVRALMAGDIALIFGAFRLQACVEFGEKHGHDVAEVEAAQGDEESDAESDEDEEADENDDHAAASDDDDEEKEDDDDEEEDEDDEESERKSDDDDEEEEEDD